ncbi:hypothetical protein AVEN_89720-1 [Araneus ventricosus]|uniref:Uncharacterized protein n=1 Tax=Araneus ventricosus TaxID=182803 RepID=A0A4Y2R9R6_ARAVE|nr:hypothetical protein AVEN_89720-1 [Araneus ventricosus]
MSLLKCQKYSKHKHFKRAYGPRWFCGRVSVSAAKGRESQTPCHRRFVVHAGLMHVRPIEDKYPPVGVEVWRAGCSDLFIIYSQLKITRYFWTQP